MIDYKASGVDIDAGNETVRRIKSLARETFTRGVLSEIGSFGGLFKLDRSAFSEPVLVSSADGVGTSIAQYLTGNIKLDPRSFLRSPFMSTPPTVFHEGSGVPINTIPPMSPVVWRSSIISRRVGSTSVSGPEAWQRTRSCLGLSPKTLPQWSRKPRI